jgi:hypothetical protein
MNQSGKDVPVTPLAIALLAASWLTFVSAFLWWGRRLQLAGKPRLVFASKQFWRLKGAIEAVGH